MKKIITENAELGGGGDFAQRVAGRAAVGAGVALGDGSDAEAPAGINLESPVGGGADRAVVEGPVDLRRRMAQDLTV